MVIKAVVNRFFTRCFVAILTMLGLTSCASLQDENYARCHQVCEKPIATPLQQSEAETSEAVIAEKEVPIMQPITINADALFEFDQYSLSAVDFSGLQEINDLIEAITKNSVEISRVRIIGHSDLIGSVNYNQQLSEQRAQTIYHYIVSRGITSKIEAVGLGTSQPVVTDCVHIKVRKTRISCESPNRRATIEVFGLHQRH